MNKIKSHLIHFFKKHPADLYFVAVSGGVDSMLLLNLLFEEKLPIHVLHVNYNLRGKDSIADENLVSNFCEINKIPITVDDVDLKFYLDNEGGNLQNEARKVRYNFFQSMQKKVSNSKVVLAHHMNDQIETFFLQLFRNSGIAGLAGMKEENNYYLRPLLPFKKEEIYDIAKALKINWREDQSNSKNNYARNQLRNNHLIELKKELPNLENSILLLQTLFQEKLNEAIKIVDELILELKKTNQLSIQIWGNLSAIEKIELLKKIEIPTYQFDAINRLQFSQKGTKVEWKMGENRFEIIRESGYFYFSSGINETFIPKLTITKTSTLPTIFSKSTIYLDETKIFGDLSIRKWKIGDRIYPIGLQGSKLISDVLTNSKIPNHLRENQFLLVDAEKVIACLNLVIDRRAIASKETKKIISIQIS